MKAALCHSFDGPEAIRIEETAAPSAAAGEVLVRVRAAALNFFDTLITRNKYQYKPSLPFSPGGEIAGEILAVGSGVTGLRVGDRIMASLTYGGLAEQVVLEADRAVKLPDAVGFEVAAGVSVTYGTALHGLRDRGRLRPGETLAVLGASGGAGLAAVEVGKALGARVIAVASSDEKLAVCQAHGADALVNYSAGDLKETLRAAAGGEGVDAVYDCVGGKYAEPALRTLKWAGRFLVVGFAAGDIPKIPLNLVLLKSCDIVGVFWGEYTRREPARNRANLARILDWVATGTLRPHIHATFPLARAVDALQVLERREAVGKVIVTL